MSEMNSNMSFESFENYLKENKFFASNKMEYLKLKALYREDITNAVLLDDMHIPSFKIEIIDESSFPYVKVTNYNNGTNFTFSLWQK